MISKEPTVYTVKRVSLFFVCRLIVGLFSVTAVESESDSNITAPFGPNIAALKVAKKY